MTKQKESNFSPIAIVGASGLFPGSIGGQSFWRNILAREDFMSEVPANHWLLDDYYDSQPGKNGKIYGKRRAFLPPPPRHTLKPGNADADFFFAR